ncbi:6-phosphogluconolactonase [Antrihabitans cavernicola]|uniref:6-phosphogluconolactonase n=1 Tax=Antrihabitans cavernicola TaxID=2495913 RepID=A0A5A7SCD2_9NOCA|nr:6-phosphogluconolactonase [Spelaeibacter cavernicola]KAA0023556.1 6-phosphogluconolactonase [Spelaeibacter cavernicola]
MSDTVIERYSDTEALIAAAATRFVDTVVAAQSARGTASVVLTGGGTGIGLLKKLRSESGDIDWSKLDIYWGDERFVPADDSERNELQARDALLDHVAVDPTRVFPMAASDGEFGNDPNAAATAYAATLAANAGGTGVPAFDIHLLGMGGEGHMNSLFPHTDAVREKQDFVVAVQDSPKPPPVRVTLTLPAVQAAKQVWLVVSGAEKADAVAAAVGGADPDDVPSAGAHGTDATVWLLDEAAASKLD